MNDRVFFNVGDKTKNEMKWMFEQKKGLMKILVCSVNWVLVVLKRNLNTIRYSKVIISPFLGWNGGPEILSVFRLTNLQRYFTMMIFLNQKRPDSDARGAESTDGWYGEVQGTSWGRFSQIFSFFIVSELKII